MEDLKKLETLDYKPEAKTIEEMAEDFCNCPPEQPAIVPPATLERNTLVTRPETRVNKAEDAGQPLEVHLLSGVCPPKTNLKIIEEIEGLISQVNEKLVSLSTGAPTTEERFKRERLKNTALEEIDLFQKTTLVELRKAVE